MKRWNGWGDETHHHHLPPNAAEFLAEKIGAATPPESATLADALRAAPDVRLAESAMIDTGAEVRLRHARGHSFPDWVALRSGEIGRWPSAVTFPTRAEDVRELMTYARRTGAKLIPYGGGTSVVGHINPPPADDAPVITVDMSRMSRLRDFDATSQLATFGAGVAGPDLEAQLRAHGYTLGHYPQSFEYSTLGGWIATRSSGQQSRYYGRIENLFAGGHVVTPDDALTLPPFPASAAGIDLREIVLGSEGRIGIITEATVRASRLPEYETFRAVFFPSFADGVNAVRAIAQAGIPLCMMRLSTAAETEANLALAGRPQAINLLERFLAARGVGAGKAMMLYGYTGSKAVGRAALSAANRIAKQHGATGGRIGPVNIGAIFGATWHKGRFKTPYLRNALWDAGYGIDTVETATTWSAAPRLLDAMEAALHSADAAFDGRLYVFTHLSHLYPHGTSIYTSYLFALADTPEANLARWAALKAAVSRAIVDGGGTISHQHGVGTDHAPYLATEKGAGGMAATSAILRHFDAAGMMNPGKLMTE